MLCIFCRKNRLTLQTKPEHILLNSFGGKKTTRSALCSSCNGRFGSTIDKELASQFTTLRNMFRLPSGDGKPAPSRRGVIAGEKKLNILGDGTMQVVQKPFTISEIVPGQINISISVNSEAEIVSLIPHIAAAAKIPQDKLIALLIDGDCTITHSRADTIHNEHSFGGPDAIRSMTKACLALWATVVGNDEMLCSVYDDARQFVISGSEAFNVSRTKLDSRIPPNSSHLKEQFGPIYNIIYVSSNHTGRVIGYFQTYNIAAWSIVLAEIGGVPNKEAVLLSNPLEPNIWLDQITNHTHIPFAWLDSPEYPRDFARARERMAEMMTFYVQWGREIEVKSMIDDALSKNGGESLPPEVIYRLSHRITNYLLSIPYKESLSLRDILGGQAVSPKGLP